jgi:hypothetical protein
MPPPSSQFWTDKADARLTACVAEGMSRSQAAAAINEQFGTSYTRSAVSGRMDRLGLKAKLSGLPKKKQPWGFHSNRIPQRRPADLRKLAPAPKPRAIAVDPVPLVKLKDCHCRAVVEERGDDGLAVFCGAERVDGSSYCAAHHGEYHARAGTPRPNGWRPRWGRVTLRTTGRVINDHER